MDKISTPAVTRMVKAGDMKGAWEAQLDQTLTVCSQKGLVEMFDSSIGAGERIYAIWWKLPAHRDTVNGCKASCIKGQMRYSNNDELTDFDPYLSSWSPYHGSIYAVLESICKELLQQAEITAKSDMTYPGVLPQNERGSKALEPAVCSTPRSI